MFREQVGTVSAWFDRWTPCEQTVAMVALLRRLHPTQARFLTSVLHRQLTDCGELRRAEILANDPSKSSSFLIVHNISKIRGKMKMIQRRIEIFIYVDLEPKLILFC